MFTRRIAQQDYLGVFTVALGTTWSCMHGDLLLKNCHLPIMCAAIARPRCLEARWHLESCAAAVDYQPV